MAAARERRRVGLIERLDLLLFLSVLGSLVWTAGTPSLRGPVAHAQAQAAAPDPSTLSDEEIERFLREADIVRTRGIGKGVTRAIRATLTDGTLTHDAQIQVVDQKRNTGPAPRGGVEINFRDTWAYNVAAYKLDRLIGLHLVPVSIERRHRNKPGAWTWWIDNVMMEEGQRLEKKIEPPNPGIWNETMQLVRVFDQLIYNMDRNMGNLLITKDWRVWAIDHTRAFRLHKELKTPGNVTRCDRAVLEALKRLNEETLKKELGDWLTTWEREALLARRDEIVEIIESKGPAGVFDRRDR